MQRLRPIRGFTLIEMSIVLVVIGLIVGGILVGQDLIRAAQVRAQITQIEKFQQATNTFRGKYGYLPGDIVPAAVSQFGFPIVPVRAGSGGRGDGNGELDGAIGNGGAPVSWGENGENLFFWEDLSSNSNLIDGGFSAAADTYPSTVCSSNSNCGNYFPSAKIGNGNFVYVYSGYVSTSAPGSYTGNGPNFFGLSIINSVGNYNNVSNGSTPAPGLSVMQAYKIDAKIDDGMPTTGNVLAQYLGGPNSNGGGLPGWPRNTATAGGTSTSCYDTTSGLYSTNINNGSGVNCGLSFKFN